MKKFAKLLSTILVLLLLILVLLTISAKTLSIGFVGPLTGPSAEMGFSSRNAFLMAYDEFHAQRNWISLYPKVMYRIEDDGGNANQGFEAVNRLLNSDIKVIIGHITSSSGRLSIPLINEMDALLISPLISHDGYMGTDDGFISLMPSASHQGRLMAEHLILTKQYKRVVFLYDPINKEFSDSVYLGLSQSLKEHGTDVLEKITLEPGADLIDLIDTIITMEPSALATVVHVSSLVGINHQVKLRNESLPIYTSMWAMVPSVIEGYGDDLRGVYGAYAINPHAQTKKYKMFKSDYFNRYGVEADFAAIYTYDATKIVLEAIKATQSTYPVKLKKWILNQRTFEGVNGEFVINVSGDAERLIFLVNAQTGELIEY
jgi:branched-chain amino acid transport system substrate-binding protein